MRRTKEAALQTRETILKAATRIISQQGANPFTIEAVAQEAGITKGGVLHHFPSKDALFEGLIDEVIAIFNARLEQALEEEPAAQKGRWLRAYIHTMFSANYDGMNLMPVLAAAVSANEHTIERLRKNIAFSQTAMLQDSIDPTLATIIRLAVDGFVFTSAFNVNMLDKTTSQKIADELIRLTYFTGDNEQK